MFVQKKIAQNYTTLSVPHYFFFTLPTIWTQAEARRLK
jgi:hypothetical protein